MKITADLHIHSRYSRACSQELTLPNIAKACERKGIHLVGTSDFTHPAWRKHIGETLKEAGEGVYCLKNESSETRFLLATELSCIYKRHGKTRRVHHVVLLPDLASVDHLTDALVARGCNVKSDGRPILGIDSEELIKMVLDASPDGLLIPAHAWTPWFSIFGSESGFDTLDECFGEMTKHIVAIETGLSSDPPMNRLLSALDGVMLVSNSDAHSLDKLGREANVFEMAAPSYREMRRILTERDASKFIETIEFFPEEGKYHADGHRDCEFWCLPDETKKRKGLCPKCGKPLTVGVLSRVAELADRPFGSEYPKHAVPFRSIIPLSELVAAIVGTGPSSKKVFNIVSELLREGRTEFGVLLDETKESLSRIATPEIADAILAMRMGHVRVRPGYDGVFGEVRFSSGIRPEQGRIAL